MATVKSSASENKKDAKQSSFSVDLRDLLEAGSHFGHQARRWNPKMEEYIFTTRDGVHIFDLGITAQKLVEAMEFVKNWVAEGKDIVFVGTKRQAAAIIKEEAAKVGAPSVHVRWLGGTITNWSEIKQRINRLKDLKEKKEKGELSKYTKKEQVLFDREIARLERFFGGIATLTDGPKALFIVDTNREQTAVYEADLESIPVIGMVDTNGDPDKITHVIPVNDDAVRSIKLVVEKIAEAYAEGKAIRAKGGQITKKQDTHNKNQTPVKSKEARGASATGKRSAKPANIASKKK